MPSLTQFIPGIIFIIVIGLINYPISLKLMNKKRILVILVPIIFLIPGILVFSLGFIEPGWGALGYFLIGGVLLLGFIGSGISSFIIYLTKRNKI